MLVWPPPAHHHRTPQCCWYAWLQVAFIVVDGRTGAASLGLMLLVGARPQRIPRRGQSACGFGVNPK
eukprot:542084-Prorocentrum_lima.AAC.1